LRDRPARSLSGGEQQRLALARGWAVRPDILFLDEPTASLDPSAKKDVEALLADFAADGMTLVMSTHNLGQAKRLASRVIYMDEGRIDIDLPTADFFASGTPGRAGLFSRESFHGRSRAESGAASRRARNRLRRAAGGGADARRGTGTQHHDGVDDEHRAVGPVRAPPARVQAGDRDRRSRRRRRHRAGPRHGAARRRRHPVRARPQAEEKLVAEGFGIKRTDVMYNDFVIVGPQGDPAGAKGRDVVAALAKIAEKSGSFISRGDKSGTHAAELRYWKTAGIDAPATKFAGYKECGCGMGPALNIAAQSDAYVLTDRGTWLSFKNRGNLAILVEGDQRLFNQYGVIVVNPAKHPHVKVQLAQAFADWVLSPAGQQTIASYKVGGEQLFFPNAPR
jgi:hypothetical protein